MVSSGPTMPPCPTTLWHNVQALVATLNTPAPRRGSPLVRASASTCWTNSADHSGGRWGLVRHGCRQVGNGEEPAQEPDDQPFYWFVRIKHSCNAMRTENRVNVRLIRMPRVDESKGRSYYLDRLTVRRQNGYRYVWADVWDG